MRIKKTIVNSGFILFILLFSIGISNNLFSHIVFEEFNYVDFNNNLKAGAFIHEPIKITSNSEFNSSNGVINGSGTEEDPYIIAHLTIDAEGTGSCISIRDTTAYFIIKNCTLLNSGSEGNYAGIYAGIYFKKVENSKIINNTIAECKQGMYLTDSNNNTILSNNCSNNQIGIFLFSSSGNSISKNNFSDSNCGIGIIASSDDNTLSENVMKNCGIYVSEKSYDNSIDTTNQVNGEPVRFYEDETGVTLSGVENVGQVILVNCSDSLIENLEISNTSIAILLTESNNNTVSSNNCSNNKWAGIELRYSSNNSILGNNCSNNDYGIYITGFSAKNIIWTNIFLNNIEYNAYIDTYEDNEWDNGTIGNYWGDYTEKYPNADNNGVTWDTAYKINGIDDSYDNYPMCNITINDTVPPQWNPMPEDQTVQLDKTFIYNVNATDFEIDSYWINDTINFSIDGNGLITNATQLPVGSYRLKIWVNDTSGNINSQVITITVKEVSNNNENTNIPGFSFVSLVGISIIFITFIIRKTQKKKKTQFQI